MKKLCIVMIVLCLLLGGVTGWFLYDRATQLQRAETNLETLIQVREQYAITLTDEEETIFSNEEAYACFQQAAEPEETEDLAQFISPEGIRFRSQSKAWGAVELQMLYTELLLNKHGDEIYSLAEVIVYPNADEAAAASHAIESYDYPLGLVFPSMPEEEIFTFTRQGGIIRLYNGDTDNTVADMAHSLSHEYGHHYTFHYMLTDELGRSLYFTTEYAKLRQLDMDLVRLAANSNEDYYDNHHWFYYEIAAEDYVTLMGSPNTRGVTDYYDIREMRDGRDDVLIHGNSRNAAPQENLMIPMATQVEGLAEYFYSFIDEPAPTYAPQTITIEMDRSSKSFNLTTGYESFYAYRFTWNKAYGEDATYTLVCFDPENYLETIHPIRTVTAGEEAEGTIGCLTDLRGNTVHIYMDGLDEGTRYFVVTVMMPDGTMYCSEPYIYTF